MWNLKYLPKFKWSHLTEKVAYERRVREQKLRVEMMQARRENAAYVQMVETGKKLDKIEARKRKRGEGGAAVSLVTAFAEAAAAAAANVWWLLYCGSKSSVIWNRSIANR